jgi:hypothetical protein
VTLLALAVLLVLSTLLLLILLRIVNMPQPIPPLALLQEELAVAAGSRVSKILLACHAILMNPHDIQVTALELANIAKLLHNISLCMNRKVGEP